MECVNCLADTETTYSVVLSNDDIIDDVPLCPDCFEITDTL